jgi:hypothetical protein
VAESSALAGIFASEGPPLVSLNLRGP